MARREDYNAQVVGICWLAAAGAAGRPMEMVDLELLAAVAAVPD